MDFLNIQSSSCIPITFNHNQPSPMQLIASACISDSVNQRTSLDFNNDSANSSNESINTRKRKLTCEQQNTSGKRQCTRSKFRIKNTPKNEEYSKAANVGYASLAKCEVYSCFVGDCRLKTYCIEVLHQHLTKFHNENEIKKNECEICKNFTAESIEDELNHLTNHIEGTLVPKLELSLRIECVESLQTADVIKEEEIDIPADEEDESEYVIIVSDDEDEEIVKQEPTIDHQYSNDETILHKEFLKPKVESNFSSDETILHPEFLDKTVMIEQSMVIDDEISGDNEVTMINYSPAAPTRRINMKQSSLDAFLKPVVKSEPIEHKFLHPADVLKPSNPRPFVRKSTVTKTAKKTEIKTFHSDPKLKEDLNEILKDVVVKTGEKIIKEAKDKRRRESAYVERNSLEGLKRLRSNSVDGKVEVGIPIESSGSKYWSKSTNSTHSNGSSSSSTSKPSKSEEKSSSSKLSKSESSSKPSKLKEPISNSSKSNSNGSSSSSSSSKSSSGSSSSKSSKSSSKSSSGSSSSSKSTSNSSPKHSSSARPTRSSSRSSKESTSSSKSTANANDQKKSSKSARNSSESSKDPSSSSKSHKDSSKDLKITVESKMEAIKNLVGMDQSFEVSKIPKNSENESEGSKSIQITSESKMAAIKHLVSLEQSFEFNTAIEKLQGLAESREKKKKEEKLKNSSEGSKHQSKSPKNSNGVLNKSTDVSKISSETSEKLPESSEKQIETLTNPTENSKNRPKSSIDLPNLGSTQQNPPIPVSSTQPPSPPFDDDLPNFSYDDFTSKLTYIDVRRLYPWIDDKITSQIIKTKTCHEALMTEKVLFSTYKCMSQTCSFFTTDFDEFKNHLSTYIDVKHICSFCLKSFNKSDDLCTHIDESHKFDRLQCNKCMFRACQKGYVELHQKEFHKKEINCEILKSPIQVFLKKERNEAIAKLKANREKFVTPFKCRTPNCYKIFFSKNNFKAHLHSEANKPSYQHLSSIICEQLYEVNNVRLSNTAEGNTQCLFCRFGNDSEQVVLHHLAKSHPSNLAYVCKRKIRSDVSDDKSKLNNRETIESHTTIEYIGDSNSKTREFKGDKNCLKSTK